MNKQELFAALESLGMRPGRGLGQNFLLDNNLLECIVRSAGVVRGMNILEVGPGFGALTSLMLDAGANVCAIEFDRRLAGYLRSTLGGRSNFHLVEGDACKVALDGLLPMPFHAVANLPYAVSSVFIARLLELPEPPASCFFMLQKEMAQRLAAVPGTGNYGALSVRAQLVYDLTLERVVPPEVFFPPPEVESALLRGTLKEQRPPREVRERTAKAAKVAFNQRRKKIVNSLGPLYGADNVRAALETMGLAADIRPERLTADQFIILAGELEKNNGAADAPEK
ncbi:MAG: 16S rRNA (adenine(1518)-N(6)/adenine(1519)-N(6))-dimethyltransferase RsmA [Victivallaceae bacterium]|nr:16S rRNA (adenine(1518)-N(6)/adenine(1519)-N(6))-dimethyltransferase RsmA [Victivallaceae bacterium]